MQASVSFMGLYSYDPSIFDDLQLPSGIDRETLINNLMVETAELEVMQPDPGIIKVVLGWFSRKRLPQWQRVADAYGLDYRMDADTDLTITRTPDLQREETRTPELEYSETRTPDLTTVGENNGADTSTIRRAGFNSENLETSEQTTTELGTGNSIHSSGTEKTERSETGSEHRQASETGSDKHETIGRRQPVPDLIARELEIAKSDVMEYIISDIRRNFCLLVY